MRREWPLVEAGFVPGCRPCARVGRRLVHEFGAALAFALAVLQLIGWGIVVGLAELRPLAGGDRRRRGERVPRADPRRAQDRGALSAAVRPLLIVDGDSFAHRYYHALPKSIRRADGGGGNLLDGVGGLLIRLWEEESPRAVLAAWDTLTVPTYRHTALPAYQSGRGSTESCSNSSTWRRSSSRRWASRPPRRRDRGGRLPRRRGRLRGSEGRHRDRGERRPRHVPARQRADDRAAAAEGRRSAGADRAGGGARALRRRAGAGARLHRAPGDPSDKIPGARGVGAKTAASLLGEYGSLEAALEQGRFAAEADALRLYRHIATMDREAPLPPLDDQQPTWERAAALADEWGLGRLAGRLEALSSS